VLFYYWSVNYIAARISQIKLNYIKVTTYTSGIQLVKGSNARENKKKK